MDCFFRWYNKLKNTSTYEDISDIFNKKTYKFSYYEIRKLSEYIKINVIILGKINDNRNNNIQAISIICAIPT